MRVQWHLCFHRPSWRLQWRLAEVVSLQSLGRSPLERYHHRNHPRFAASLSAFRDGVSGTTARSVVDWNVQEVEWIVAAFVTGAVMRSLVFVAILHWLRVLRGDRAMGQTLLQISTSLLPPHRLIEDRIVHHPPPVVPDDGCVSQLPCPSFSAISRSSVAMPTVPAHGTYRPSSATGRTSQSDTPRTTHQYNANHCR